MAMLATLLALAFGAVDQYVGSLSAHPLGADISGLSAPWLVLPFAVGASQSSRRRAAWLGLACTFAALVGYMLMTLSPTENAHLSVTGIVHFVRGGNFLWFASGVVTGPLFAWLGCTWRAQRALLAGLVTAAAICLEPVVRQWYGNAIQSSLVADVEVALGLAVGSVMVVRALRHSAPAA